MSSGGKKIAMNALAEVQVVYQVYQKKINERVEKSFQFCDKVVIKKGFRGKSFSEALIVASSNPQYDKRLFMELHQLLG